MKEIATVFQASWTATAIRLIELGHMPSMLICHGLKGRKWFARGPDVPSRWFPREDLDPQSFAFNILFGRGLEDEVPRKVGADAWFDRTEAHRYDVQEQTFRTSDSEPITLLTISDPQMVGET